MSHAQFDPNLEPPKTTIEVVTFTSYGYAFDRSNPNWIPEVEYSMLFLRSQARYLNVLLDRRGHLFLNEVHDALGFERTPAGQVAGWLRNHGYFAMDAKIREAMPGTLWVSWDVQGVIVNDI